jgi:hypothetical protein
MVHCNIMRANGAGSFLLLYSPTNASKHVQGIGFCDHPCIQ